jgi:hypothetical protein
MLVEQALTPIYAWYRYFSVQFRENLNFGHRQSDQCHYQGFL